jgi:hypothetical protein
MDDIITIEECITRLDTIRHEIVPDSRDHFALSAGIAALYEMENGVPAVNRWIPVEDALPEIYEKVLTADIDGYVTENYRCNVRTGLEWAKGFRITHWMPLPEPPEKE